jgi:hypothetical protein
VLTPLTWPIGAALVSSFTLALTWQLGVVLALSLSLVSLLGVVVGVVVGAM